MLKNYYNIAVRNIIKHKLFSFINISGLALGLACCMLIGIYIKDELSYDKFHKNADNIYRITREFKSPDGSTSLHLSRLAPPFLPLLKNDFPEMKTMTRFISFGGTIKYENKIFIEENVGWADNNIFDVFDFEFIHGNPENALLDPGSMVINEDIANKYFGGTDVIGKTIRFSNQANLKITGVVKRMPENSHFNLEMIGDFSLVEQYYGGRENMINEWGSNNFSTYFILDDQASISEVERRLPDFLTRHLGENANDWNALHIQKLTDIHLHSHLDDELGANSDIRHVYTFAAIGLLILFIAIINYMNLATAKSANRAREVGMRKVMGAGKSSLVGQFLIESIVLVSIAIVIAFIIVQFSLPYLRAFTDRILEFDTEQSIMAFSIVIAFGLLIGVLSGSYPAFYLSSFDPLRVLKGKLSAGSKSTAFRRSLVVLQFSISAILIVSTGVIFQQLSYIQNKNLGYDKDHILTIRLNEEITTKFEVFKNILLGHQSIDNVGTSSRIPTIQLLDSQGAEAEINGEMVAPEVTLKGLRVDHDFLDTYNIKIMAGRNFDKTIQADDTSAYLLNETAVKMTGWESNEEAINKKITYGGRKGRVIGVVQDIHFETLQNKISPLIMQIPQNHGRYVSIKMKGDQVNETIKFIEAQWSEFSPNTPIQYHFIDERYDRLYNPENRRAQLFTGFSLIAIFLACLGLFGLSSFTVSQRSKEISIRKVLGASITEIVSILSKEFIILVGISIFVAFPLAYIFSKQWLQNYAYRIELNLLPFILAGILSLLIAFCTISFQTFKAANSNPVDALKDE
ncbi:ABC transporter permease [Reichenbachiella sp. MALMAid0571]|uniref:ABC transporter permease n=1 Tax=Reichenbachiella sp. MALMAid0571 TaxID=3143939 RepID=UPI0032DF4669